MASRKTNKKGTKKRAQRATSNVFAMFGQDQIQVKPFFCIKFFCNKLIFENFFEFIIFMVGIQRGFQHDRPESRWFY